MSQPTLGVDQLAAFVTKPAVLNQRSNRLQIGRQTDSVDVAKVHDAGVESSLEPRTAHLLAGS
jgi:hypothetical protein